MLKIFTGKRLKWLEGMGDGTGCEEREQNTKCTLKIVKEKNLTKKFKEAYKISLQFCNDLEIIMLSKLISNL